MDSDGGLSGLMDKVTEALDELGCYVEDANVMGMAPAFLDEDDDDSDGMVTDQGEIADMIKADHGEFALTLTLRLGERAWRDQTLRPEKYDADELLRQAGMTDRDARKSLIEEQLAAGVPLDQIKIDLDVSDEVDDAQD